MRKTILAACLAMLFRATAAPAGEPVPEPDLSRPEEPVPFLLAPESRPRTARILPPAPVAGSAAYEADRRVFRETRRLASTPLWTLARHDVDMAVPAMLADFSCAAGMALTPVKTPMLAGLLTRASADAERAIEPAKAANRRERPFLLDEGAICQPREDLASSDYPSGHATWGWTVGLLLAELVPERSTQVLQRSRAYAEGRVACGAHNRSAVDAGLMNAAALVAALHGSAEFRAAMETARGEVAAVRAAGGPPPDQATCALERAAGEAAAG